MGVFQAFKAFLGKEEMHGGISQHGIHVRGILGNKEKCTRGYNRNKSISGACWEIKE